MSKLFGSQAQAEWEAHLAEVRQRWRTLGDQTAALRSRQEQTLRAVFSGAGLSDAEAAAEVARYLQGRSASHSASSLAEFVRAGHGLNPDAKPVLSPAVEDIPALITALQAEWEQMFSRLRNRLPSPRGQALLAARKSSGLPVHSLDEAALWPVKDIALLHDPDEAGRVASLGLDGDVEKGPDEDTPPKKTAGVGDKIAGKIREHLRLQREIKKLDDFWTDEAASVAAFISARPPESKDVPAGTTPARLRVWWRPSTWFRKSTRASAAAVANSPDVVWREPVPPHVPTDPKIARQLHEWRAQTEKEAEALRAADTGWTQRVGKVGAELAARRASEAKHPALELDPDAMSQAGLEKAQDLGGSQAEAALQLSGEILATMSAILPELARNPAES